MKRFLIIVPVFLALLFSCTREMPLTTPQFNSDIVFNITPEYDGAATKAKKTAWEKGDVILVFFSGVSTPKYLKMSYNGTSWSYTEMNGSTAGSLGLKNNDTGKLVAVYLPFGSDATVRAGNSSAGEYETGFYITKYYTYYLRTANVTYTVTGNSLSLFLSFKLPDDSVQFFVADSKAAHEGYKLATNEVQPVALSAVVPDGENMVYLEDFSSAGSNMTGYAYVGGYLFSGRLAAGYKGGKHYFIKMPKDNSSRADLFVSGTLQSRSAIVLPENSSERWQAVGQNITVTLKKGTTSLGTWYTCNEGSVVPDVVGTPMIHSAASTAAVSPKKLPTKAQYDNLIANCAKTAISIHGNSGVVLSSDTGFLFFPVQSSQAGYWYESSTNIFNVYITSGTGYVGYEDSSSQAYQYVRFVQ